MGKCMVFMGKCMVFIGKCMVFMGKCMVFMGKCMVFMWKCMVFMGKSMVFTTCLIFGLRSLCFRFQNGPAVSERFPGEKKEAICRVPSLAVIAQVKEEKSLKIFLRSNVQLSKRHFSCLRPNNFQICFLETILQWSGCHVWQYSVRSPNQKTKPRNIAYGSTTQLQI